MSYADEIFKVVPKLHPFLVSKNVLKEFIIGTKEVGPITNEKFALTAIKFSPEQVITHVFEWACVNNILEKRGLQRQDWFNLYNTFRDNYNNLPTLEFKNLKIL